MEDRFDPDKHPKLLLNFNHITALNELMLDDTHLFIAGLRHNEADGRTIVARLNNFDQPGWREVDIDQNGDVFHRGTGGLD